MQEKIQKIMQNKREPPDAYYRTQICYSQTKIFSSIIN